MGKRKWFSGGRVILLTTVLVGGFASSSFAHYCYNANKPNGAGTVSLSETWVNKNGKFIIPGGFIDPAEFGAPEEYKDVFAHAYLDKAAKNGSPTNGVQEYSFPE